MNTIVTLKVTQVVRLEYRSLTYFDPQIQVQADAKAHEEDQVEADAKVHQEGQVHALHALHRGELRIRRNLQPRTWKCIHYARGCSSRQRMSAQSNASRGCTSRGLADVIRLGPTLWRANQGTHVQRLQRVECSYQRFAIPREWRVLQAKRRVHLCCSIQGFNLPLSVTVYCTVFPSVIVYLTVFLSVIVYFTVFLSVCQLF